MQKDICSGNKIHWSLPSPLPDNKKPFDDNAASSCWGWLMTSRLYPDHFAPRTVLYTKIDPTVTLFFLKKQLWSSRTHQKTFLGRSTSWGVTFKLWKAKIVLRVKKIHNRFTCYVCMIFNNLIKICVCVQLSRNTIGEFSNIRARCWRCSHEWKTIFITATTAKK